MVTKLSLKSKSLKSVKQAIGTLKMAAGMVEEDRYCPDIIQQLDSVMGLLKLAKRQLLAGHLDTCVAHQMNDDKKRAIAELLKIFNLSN